MTVVDMWEVTRFIRTVIVITSSARFSTRLFIWNRHRTRMLRVMFRVLHLRSISRAVRSVTSERAALLTRVTVSVSRRRTTLWEKFGTRVTVVNRVYMVLRLVVAGVTALVVALLVSLEEVVSLVVLSEVVGHLERGVTFRVGNLALPVVREVVTHSMTLGTAMTLLREARLLVARLLWSPRMLLLRTQHLQVPWKALVLLLSTKSDSVLCAEECRARGRGSLTLFRRTLALITPSAQLGRERL